jgi:uncharacterized membrane-anchored protein
MIPPEEGLSVSARSGLEDNGAFAVHPARARVLAEVHARPFMPIEPPRRILHFGFMTDHWAAAKDRAAFEAFCLARACPAPLPDAKHHRVELSPALLRWEHHGEFTTYTWEFPGDDGGQAPFRPGPNEFAHLMRLLPAPGPMLVAVDLHILPEKAVGDGFRHLFGPAQLAASDVEDGGARIATDFHQDAFGFVRILVLDRKLAPAQAGALVQRLLEIETYRTLALLGLPEAQDLIPSIRRIETELPLLMNKMRESQGFDANKHLLDRLTALSADLEAGAARGLFRFGATRAYDELVGARIESLGERPFGALPTLAAFLSRRLTPAIHTCASTQARQENLSRKLSRAAQLLRTRVEIELESQNNDVLHKMNDRARMQLRLQQMVEGLSIAALTYYISAIFHLIFAGVHTRVAWLDPTVATALVVPVAFVVAAFSVRRIRKHFEEK